MTSKKDRAAAMLPTAAARRRRVTGVVTGLALAAALTATAVPAMAQSQDSNKAPSGHSAQHHYLSPLQVTSAYYASYNGDLAAASTATSPRTWSSTGSTDLSSARTGSRAISTSRPGSRASR
ncbi:hypothetical protein ACFQ51_39120 [Streptomyces kaempferi]